MSYTRNISMRIVLPTILAMIASMMVQAAETARLWTNTKGKTVEGILQEKGDGWAKILVKGKVYQIPLDTLIKPDQEYIKNAELGEEPPAEERSSDDPEDPKPAEPEPEDSKPKEPMEDEKPKPAPERAIGDAVGLKISEAEPNYEDPGDGKFTPVRLKFEVKGVSEGGVHCILIWMAHFRAGGGGTEPHNTHVDFFAKDGEYFIQELFSNNSQSGARYKGYAVRLLNTKYEQVAEMANDPTYLKELDKAQRMQFPGTLPEAEDEE